VAKETLSQENSKREILQARDYWNKVLKQEFEKETDRGAAIFSTSLFDEALKNLLLSYFAASTSSSDELFDGPNAPLTSLSSKITLCYRLGLLSNRFVRDLNLIRKIRNEFAHNIQGCDFNHTAIYSRIQELEKSSQTVSKLNVMEGLKQDEKKDSRNIFLQTCSWMLSAIQSKISELNPISPAKREFGYLELDTIIDFKKFLDEKHPELFKKEDKLPRIEDK
jgi:DNA-binding MltR family transcriptional regulator